MKINIGNLSNSRVVHLCRAQTKIFTIIVKKCAIKYISEEIKQKERKYDKINDNLENCLKWNCKVPIKFISKAYKAGIKKFVILGTYHEYGMAGNIYKNKKTPVLSSLMPVSTYAMSKAIFFASFSFLP